MVSGLFVGMVLGLQGYDTLNKYGAGDSLGVFVGLSLVRELGPVVAGLLFASRAGSAITAEIGLMKTTEQLSAMEMMAVDPLARIVAPRFWGGVISMPLLAALFSVMGVFGAYLVGVRLIGVDNGTFWGNMQAGIDFWPDITNGIIKSFVFGVAVSLDRRVRRLRRQAHGGGRVGRDHAHGRRRVARDPGARFRADGIHVQGTGEWIGNTESAPHEPLDHRPVGRHLRHDRFRRDRVSRAQGRQPDLARQRSRAYRARRATSTTSAD